MAIARALVGEPSMLLADEPTGALDPETGHAIMKLLFELNASEQLTVAIITHDRELALECPRRTRMLEGVLHETSARDGPSRANDRR